MSVTKEKNYLWVRAHQPPLIVNNVLQIFGDYDPDHDKLYEIGNEVKLDLSIKVIPTKLVTRFYDHSNKE